MIRVLFLIRDLDTGGAQRQLVTLARALDKSRFETLIVTFYANGELRPELDREPAVRVYSLNKRGRWDNLALARRLRRLVQHFQPAILHGYLDEANLAALLTGRRAGTKVVWGIRASDMDFPRKDPVPGYVHSLCNRLSRFVDLAIFNSESGEEFHRKQGFNAKARVVIPNGIDTHRFRPLSTDGVAVRASLRVPESRKLIGLVARLEPMKDHACFLRAAAIACATREDIGFVCMGKGAQAYERRLHALSRELGLETRVVWIPGREDMPAVYNAFDLLTLTSAYGEGLPNVLGEAMACGVPCVATDVGDVRRFLSDPACTVPPGDPAALAAAWLRTLELPADERQSRAVRVRDRVSSEYSVAQLAARTETALTGLLER